MFTLALYGGRHRKERDVVVWLHFYECLNAMFSQQILILWSLLQRLSQKINDYVNLYTRTKTASKYMLTFTLTYKIGHRHGE